MTMEGGADDLLALLGDVDIPADEWFFPLAVNEDAQLVPLLTLASDSDSSASLKSDAVQEPDRLSTPPKRRTRKQELDLLRQQVERMTLQLHSLKLAAGIDVATPVAAIPRDQKRLLTTVTAARAAQGCCLWEALAAKQLKRRLEAERDNQELREAVETHGRRAKKLRQLLLKRANDEQRQLTGLVGKPGEAVSISLPDDERVFERLAKGMDEAYASIDATFRNAKMHELPVPGQSSKGFGLEVGRWRVELRNAHVMPFAFKQAERATWMCMAKEPGNKGREVRGSIRFTVQFPNGGAMAMHQRSVTRRYREEERTVVVCRSLTEPVPGISMDSTKLIVISSGEDSVSGPTTVVRTYIFALGSATPEVSQRVADEHQLRRAPISDEFGLEAWEKSITKAQDEIEDVLVGR